MHLKLIITGIVLILIAGCSNLRQLTSNNTLAIDTAHIPNGDLAGLGPQQIKATRLLIDHQGKTLSVALY